MVQGIFKQHKMTLQILFSILLSFTIAICSGQQYSLSAFAVGVNDDFYGKRSMAIDSDGHVYAAGVHKTAFGIQDSSLQGMGIYLAKFDSSLTLIWIKNVAQILGAGSNLAGHQIKLDLDSENNPFIAYSAWTGRYLKYNDSLIIQSENVEIIKFNPAGIRTWRKSLVGSRKLGDKGLTIDNSDKILITGIDLNDNLFIAKLDNNGNEIFFKSAGVLGLNDVDEGEIIATDSMDNVYIAGHLHSNGPSDTAVFDNYSIILPQPCYSAYCFAKYSPSGAFLWVKYIYSEDPTMYSPYGSSTITDLEISQSGQLILGGFFTNELLLFSDEQSPLVKVGNIGFRSAFLCSYNLDGSASWSKNLHDTNNGGSNVIDVCIDEADNIYSLNEFWGNISNSLNAFGSPNTTESLLEKYDTYGNILTASDFGCDYADLAYDFKTNDKNLYVLTSTDGQDNIPFVIGNDSIVFNGLNNNMLLLKLHEEESTNLIENDCCKSVNIYPNPNNGIFHIQFSESILSYSIYNCLGEIMLESQNNSQKPIAVDIESYQPGMYFLVIYTDNGIHSHPILKL
ncbi:MAG: hypothetical protein RL362_815 [Bacteroidota bacterium]